MACTVCPASVPAAARKPRAAIQLCGPVSATTIAPRLQGLDRTVSCLSEDIAAILRWALPPNGSVHSLRLGHLTEPSIPIAMSAMPRFSSIRLQRGRDPTYDPVTAPATSQNPPDSHLPHEGLLPSELFVEAFDRNAELIKQLCCLKYEMQDLEKEGELDIVIHRKDIFALRS